MAVNLGQVAGLHIGSSAPTNTNLIWFDNTYGVNLHKVYDFGSNQWVVLDQNLVISITYADLVTLSQNQLTIGQWFKITDLGNLMAIALTTTIVQYTNIAGNIVLDDLGNSKQYIVTNNNLTIEDVNGVFNNDRLNFEFTPYHLDSASTFQYIMGVDEIGGVPTLIKIPTASLISSDLNNVLSFGNDGGLFIDLVTEIANLYDVPNGVVSYNNYISNMNNIASQLNNMNSAIANFQTNIINYIQTQVSDINIYSKRVPTVNTNIAPSDILANDTLQTIVNKAQRFINKFKFATGIDISPSFTDVINSGWVNNNDTIERAIEKIQYILKHIGSIGHLSSTWQPEDYTQHINDLQPLDSFDLAFGKIQGKLNQIGVIENGSITAKTNKMILRIDDGLISIASPIGLLRGYLIGNNNGEITNIRDDCSAFSFNSTETPIATGNNPVSVNSGVGVLANGYKANKDGIAAAIAARLERPLSTDVTQWQNIFNDNIELADGYFQFLKLNALNFKFKTFANNSSFVNITDETFVFISNVFQNGVIALPPQTECGVGRIIFLMIRQQVVADTNTISANGGVIVEQDGSISPNYYSTMTVHENTLYLLVTKDAKYGGNQREWQITKIG